MFSLYEWNVITDTQEEQSLRPMADNNPTNIHRQVMSSHKWAFSLLPGWQVAWKGATVATAAPTEELRGAADKARAKMEDPLVAGCSIA